MLESMDWPDCSDCHSFVLGAGMNRVLTSLFFDEVSDDPSLSTSASY
jgi:hypothetical protein